MSTVGKFVECRDETILDKALELCRGSYQQNILLGTEAISGSTLRGKARDYSARYAKSARAILKRCQEAGLPIEVVTKDHGRRVVLIG